MCPVAPPSRLRRLPCVRPPALPPCTLAAYVLAATVLAFLLYGPALHGPFLFDDRYLPFLSQNLAAKPLSAWLGGVRPLVNLSFYVNAQISGTDPWSYHAANVILHALNSVLVYYLAKWFLLRIAVPAERREWLSLFAGALFLVHPLQTEAVAYVTSRSETLAVFFFYSAFVVFLYRRDRGLTWGWTIAVLALFAASQLAKEYAAVFPFLLLLTDWIFPARPRGLETLRPLQSIRRNWRVYLLMLIGGSIAGVLIVRVLAGTTSAGFRLREVGPAGYFLTECRVIWEYLRLSAVPLGLNIDPDFPFVRGLTDPFALLGLLALLVCAAAAIYLRKRYPMACFGCLAMLLCLAPTSSFLPIADPFAEHRMYLPMFGLILIALDVLWRIQRVQRGTLVGATSCLLVVFAYLTFARNAAWGNEVALWQDTAAKSPNKVRPRFQLAFSYYTVGRCKDAVTEFETAAKLAAPSYELLHDWAEAEDCAGHEDQALALFQRAAMQQPTGLVSSQIGMVLAKQGRYRESLEALALAEKQDPSLAVVYAYRGNIDYLQGDYAHAAEQFSRALSLDPDNRMANDGLSLARQKLASVR